ncbi:MAG: hypothetical protein GF398_21890, partial [Chitinivibrionales bacterium]|nr:hypothetical protein [Chitinivibrionales bacterium]
MKYKNEIIAGFLFSVVLLSIAAAAFLVTCVPGPIDPVPLEDDYLGEYAFEISLDSLPDTMYVLKTYNAVWRDIAKDRHWTFVASTRSDSILDSAYLHEPSAENSDSLLRLYFLKPYNDTLSIWGVRRNHKLSHDTSFIVRVLNRFSLQVDSSTLVSNQDFHFSIKNLKRFADDTLISVVWYVNNVKRDSLPLDSDFVKKAAIAETLEIGAAVHDRRGNELMLETMQLSVKPDDAPSIAFLLDSMEAAVGQEVTISARCENCDSVRWAIKQLGSQLTSGSAIKATFAKDGRDTIIATGYGNYGLSSTDTLIVSVVNYTYQLKLGTTFPDTIRAKRWATWEASVLLNG